MTRLRAGLRNPRRWSQRRSPRCSAVSAACCMREIERRVDLQSALVEILDAEFLAPLDVLPDLLARNRRRSRGASSLYVPRTIGAFDGLLELLRVDVVLLEHPPQHVIAPRDGVVRMRDRAVVHRRRGSVRRSAPPRGWSDPSHACRSRAATPPRRRRRRGRGRPDSRTARRSGPW